MCKRHVFTILLIIFITAFASTAYAVPSTDIGLIVWPYWQFQSEWADMPYDHKGTIGEYGCALTSLSMLLKYYGLKWIPDIMYMTQFMEQNLIPLILMSG